MTRAGASNWPSSPSTSRDSSQGVGDAGDLLRHGASRWTLIAFGLACVPCGLFLWHGLSPHFGLGEAKGLVTGITGFGSQVWWRSVTIAATVLSLLVIVLFWHPRTILGILVDVA